MEIIRESISKNDNYFIPIYHMFINYKKSVDYETGEIIENKYTLTADELYIYSYLYMNRNFNNITKINIDIISQEITLTSKKDKPLRKDKNKMAIVDILVNLKKKGIILFNDKNLSYSKVLNIEFYKFSQDNGKGCGYQQINYDIFQKARNAKEFFILCCILSIRDGKGISYSELAQRIGHSRNHVVYIINKMSDDTNLNRIINKIRGQHYIDEEGNIKQNANSYRLNNRKVLFIEQREHNWYDWSEKLTYQDYIIYKTTEDETLIKEANKRIETIKKTKPNFFDNWESKFENKNHLNKNEEWGTIHQSSKITKKIKKVHIDEYLYS